MSDRDGDHDSSGDGSGTAPSVGRRGFIAVLAGAGLAGAIGVRSTGAGPSTPAVPAAALGSAASPRPSSAVGTLVVLTLEGGNDGLDTVVPSRASAYRAARGALAQDPDEVLDVGEGLGLHPALRELKRAFDADRLAIVRGVGFADLDRSHFHCMDLWQSGGGHDPSTGWLGRWLDRSAPDPLAAIAVGSDLPLLVRGAKRSASVVAPGPAQIPGGPRLARLYEQMSNGGPTRATTLTRAAATAGADMGAVVAEVAAAYGGRTPGAGSQLAIDLDLVADLIEADLPTRVFAVTMGGFDTHAAQAATHARLLADLDAGLGAFLQRVGDRPVTVLVYSEFGRRLAANASGGTDHGAAGPVFLLGPRVRGGLYGEDPSLTVLVEGDLRAAVDPRSLYATVLNGVLGVDADVAIADAVRYPAFPLLA